MSDDAINLVQSFIDSKKGDTNRLQEILIKLQQGNSLDASDQSYLDEIIKEVQAAEQTPSETLEHPNSEILEHPDFSEQQNVEHESLDDAVIRETRNSPSRKRVIAISAVIVSIVVAYVGLDVYSVGTLQFRPVQGNQYQISPTEIHIRAAVCNPSFFPVTFNKYEISAFYDSEPIEKAEINGSTVSPKTASVVEGIFVLNADSILKLKEKNATFDPTLAKITTTVDAPIFGAIPFSVVKQYSAEQFQDVLRNGPPGDFSCS